jgi:serine/threonine-protein kinase
VTSAGEVLSQAAWGSPLPVDPGEVVVAASAPNHRPWETRVTAHEGTTTTVDVPALERDVIVTPPPLPPTPPVMSKPAKGSAMPSILVMVGGGAGVIFGLITGGLAISLDGSADSKCGAGNTQCTDPVAIQESKDARTWAMASTISMIAGSVILATGVVLYLLR